MEKETDKRVITLADVQNHPMVIACIRQADQNLKAMGFTEHGFRHTDMVANTAHRVLTQLGYSQREAELAAIAGYMHDLGNVVERSHHYYTGRSLPWISCANWGWINGYNRSGRSHW
jgi:uncharacterized protein